MNLRLKIIFIVGLALTWNLSFSQSILKELHKDKRIKNDKEMILEISELFNKVTDSLKTDFNNSNTLCIIRGVDIQSRTGYGYVWNNRLKTSYIDNKIWKGNKIVGSKPLIKIKTDITSWHEFDDLVPLIEKWDTGGINNYVENCGEVLSGIYGWTIIRLVKQDSRYDLNLIYIRNFGLCNEN